MIKIKKGALMQATIITIIIVLIAGAILMIVLSKMSGKEQYDKDACHNSVLLRSSGVIGSLAKGTEFTPELFPLRCKTQEIEIKTIDEEIAKRIIANAMYDCWWMLGEGELNFFDDKRLLGIGANKATCVICSTIRFDEITKRRIKEIDITDYLSSKKIPLKNVTYLDYFSGGENTKLPAELRIQKIDTSQDYAVYFMFIKGDDIVSALKDFGNFNLMIWGGSVALGGGKGPIQLVKYAIKFPHIAALIEGAAFAVRSFFVWKNSNAAFAHCTESQSVNGCNALIVAPFDKENIEQICQKIESIP